MMEDLEYKIRGRVNWSGRHKSGGGWSALVSLTMKRADGSTYDQAVPVVAFDMREIPSVGDQIEVAGYVKPGRANDERRSPIAELVCTHWKAVKL